jgi:uncharacterized protein (DUF58 family)
LGLLDVFKRAHLPVSRRFSQRPSAGEELFDDDFQRKLEMLAMVSRRVFAGRMRAERRTKKKGSGVEFADHRKYVEGDDFRYVDWNVYQRFGKLLVRLYEEEEDLSIYLIVDCSSSMAFGDGKKFDHARRLCAALAYVGLANLDRVTIVAVSDGELVRMPPTRGKGRIFKVLNFLRELEANGTTELAETLRMFVAQHKRRGLAVLISDLYDPAGFEGGINMLRFNKFEPFVMHIVDPREARPELKGDVRIYDCETGDERELTVTANMLDKIGQAWEQYAQSIERFCASRQVPYFAASVNVEFEELILQVFRRGGFLR